MKKISLIELTPEELVDQTADKVFARIKEHLAQRETKETYLTRQEAANLLQLSLPTLDGYCKRGFLPSYRIGKTIRFKESEIKQIVNGGLRYNLKKKGGKL